MNSTVHVHQRSDNPTKSRQNEGREGRGGEVVEVVEEGQVGGGDGGGTGEGQQEPNEPKRETSQTISSMDSAGVFIDCIDVMDPKRQKNVCMNSEFSITSAPKLSQHKSFDERSRSFRWQLAPSTIHRKLVDDRPLFYIIGT